MTQDVPGDEVGVAGWAYKGFDDDTGNCGLHVFYHQSTFGLTMSVIVL